MKWLGSAFCLWSVPLVAACAAGAAPEPAPAEPVAVAPTAPASVPTAAALPATATAVPTVQPSITEARVVEVEWPSRVRVGDSDVVRLSLLVAGDGYVVPTAQFAGGEVRGEPIAIPDLYETHHVVAVARLDAIGLEIDRPGDWAQPLSRGDNLTWLWTLRANEAGQQRANLLLGLRFVPRAGGDTLERLVWAQSLTIRTTTVFGLSGPLAQGLGVFGSILGSVLGFPFADKFWTLVWERLRGRRKKL